MIQDYPILALSVRQPWAWAIIYGGKDVENRSQAAVSKGGMKPRSICIHASKGMTQQEYQSAASMMADIGVKCPPPDELVRGGVIGTVDVVSIDNASDSPWFFKRPKNRALTLANPSPIHFPIPCQGALGFFNWDAGGRLEAPKPWMTATAEGPRPEREEAPLPLLELDGRLR